MYPDFENIGVEIIALGPDGPRAFKKFWDEENIPYIGCADIGSKVADSFQQEVNIFKFGRMPAEFIVSIDGIILYSHFGTSMSDIPDPTFLLKKIKELNNIIKTMGLNQY